LRPPKPRDFSARRGKPQTGFKMATVFQYIALMPSVAPKTPCVGLCSTVYGDLICRGCKRFHHEVIAWNGYTASEKQAVLQRLDRLLAPLIERRFELLDVELLRKQLISQGIHFCQTQSPYAWICSLLARRARQITRLADYGLALRPVAEGQTLMELYQTIESEFFALSEAYYQRYLTLSPSPSPEAN